MTTFPSTLTQQQKGILKGFMNSPDERIRAAIVGVFPNGFLYMNRVCLLECQQF